MDDKKQIIKISVFITSVFVIFLSVTYAFINVQLEGTKKQVITAGTLDLELDEDENNLTITDALPMYDEVGMIQDAFTFRLINNVEMPTNYILKLTDITVGDKLPTSIVKYGLTKNGEGEPALLSTLPEDGEIDSGVIGDKETIEYTLRLWIDSSVKDNSVISGKSLSYRVDVEVNQEVLTVSSPSVVFDTVTNDIGENCGTYTDGIDTFLVGECSKNYVWYSGKLWRVVSKNNSTGAIKMITDNGMTAISYNNEGNVDFDGSYADQWLNQEFLPTLHDYEDYLVTNSVWDTSILTDVTVRPSKTKTVTRTVGLLNAYELSIMNDETYNRYESSRFYLNNDSVWWLLNAYDAQSVYIYAGGVYADLSGAIFSIRPVVNLKSTILIEDGSGIKTDPYILEGDTQELINGTTLLNTRYSGEYLTFNNELYRIVGVEDGLTKIVSVNVPELLKDVVFDSTGKIDFAETEIFEVLDNYYYNRMNDPFLAAEDSSWYYGAISYGSSYKLGICASSDASTSTRDCSRTTATTTSPIGMLRLGEMFVSQITRDEFDEFWILTPFDNSSLFSNNYGDFIFEKSVTSESGVRPSLYIRSDVTIWEENTGNGTYENPYTLTPFWQ